MGVKVPRVTTPPPGSKRERSPGRSGLDRSGSTPIVTVRFYEELPDSLERIEIPAPDECAYGELRRGLVDSAEFDPISG
jgi:hypothetical protein